MIRLAAAGAVFAAALAAGTAMITVDYPESGSIFPPEITPPTFIWRDAAADAVAWTIDVEFAGGSGGIHVKSSGERLRVGEIDPRCVAPTNELPKLTPNEAAAHSWKPDAKIWAGIRKRSVERPAKVTIAGYRDKKAREPVSRGSVTFQTSKDPVGAPVFYRDVPLMPSESEKGVIKPLAESAQPLISWRLRNIGEPRSRVLMEGLPTCANCHSFSRDGKTMGLDLDGPRNDKGMYAIARVKPQMAIRNEDVISWNSFQDQPAGRMRVGFMSQVSPDGRYVVTTVTGRREDLNRNYYVVNFKDYRFLQVFYATRGILAWYDTATGRRQALPGADDPRYVQTNAVWSPDGKYLVFARADAADSYPEGRKLAEFANDPGETQIQYDLYRIPFDEGRGGQAEPIAGASRNGMSNAFAKVSPDGKWIVFVKCRNALLMRPDSQLYIVPAEGGQARRMRCNLPLMNSWHSFSPNGRWLVFSSKGRSPYTQMFLTHIDEDGNDSPAILVENSTAANRAVNIPEFVNIPPDGLLKIDVPAVQFYSLFNRAWDLMRKGQLEAAIAEWQKALEISPSDTKANNNLGFALAQKGRMDEAIAHWRKALEANDDYAEVHENLGRALLAKGDVDEAILHWQRAVEITPEDAKVRVNLGVALLRKEKFDDAIPHFRKVLEAKPRDIDAHYNLAVALMRKGMVDEAILHYQNALETDPKDMHANNDLGVAMLQRGRIDEAIARFEKAIAANRDFAQAHKNLGSAYYLQRRSADAVAEWRKALHIEPDNQAVLNSTAWVLATTPDAPVRNGVEAVSLAARAVQLSQGRQPEYLDTLAAAYAEAGRFAEAVETARRALALAVEQNKQSLVQGLKARIVLYEGQTTYREPRP